MDPSITLTGIVPILPEIVLAGGAMALLMLGVFRTPRSEGLIDALSIVLLVVAGLLVIFLPEGKLVTFGGSFVVDDFARFLKILAIIGSAAAILMSIDYDRREQQQRFEYSVLIVLSTLGMLMLISAADLIALYLGLELMSLALYVLAASHRTSLRSTEAGLKYFVLGAVSSGMLLYGASLVYGFTGTVNFAGIAHSAAAAGTAAAGTGLIFGLVFLFAAPSASKCRQYRSICGPRTCTRARRPPLPLSLPPRSKLPASPCSCGWRSSRFRASPDSGRKSSASFPSPPCCWARSLPSANAASSA
jgi:NADH-quinone oxidoreductase subunit N